MEFFVLQEESNSSSTTPTPKKKYRCPYCDERYEREKLHIHIQNKHEDLIPEGYTALRVAFNTINHKDHGSCIICGKETDWNEKKGRYERLCNDPACKEKYKQMAAERNKKIYGTDRLQSDPRYAEEVQKKALAGRRTSGTYKFQDGGEIGYMGKYEKLFLQFMDQIMECKSEDIIAPGPAIQYPYNGEKHMYLPDFYYIPYNLIIEIKDGGDNPNNHSHRTGEDEARLQAKEAFIKKQKKYNYVRQVNNDFSQVMRMMAILKFRLLDGKDTPVMKIFEGTMIQEEDGMLEDMSGTIGAALPLNPVPKPYETDPDNYYYVQLPQNMTFIGNITKDPTQHSMLTAEIDKDGYYRVKSKENKDFTDNYVTFKIKDKQKAKELYDELAYICKNNEKIYSEDSHKDYIYWRLTGKDLLKEDQAIFDKDNFELVKSFNEELLEECNEFYRWLKNDPIITLEEQVKDIESTYLQEFNLYEVLPDDIEDIEELIRWKYRFDSMTYYQRLISNDMSIAQYGENNIDRYNKKYAELISKVNPEEAIGESTTEESYWHDIDDWLYRMDRARQAEQDGLIIMIDTNKYETLEDYEKYAYSNEDKIYELKKKFERFQNLPENKRVLSNQTAQSIFGVDNYVLYERILNKYLSRQNPLVNGDTLNQVNGGINSTEYMDLTTGVENPELQEAVNNTNWAECITIEDPEKYILESKEATENISNKLTSEYLKDKIVPVFVCLCKGVKLHSLGIRWFTDSEWSHASMGFDSSMKELYTFTVYEDESKKVFGRYRNGFSVDTFQKYIKDGIEKIKVYALFVTSEQRDAMKEAVQWYIDHQDDTRYNFKGLFDILRRKPKTPDKGKMVCSQFVYTILQVAKLYMRKNKISSNISPADLDELTDDARFYCVFQGKIEEYNKKKVDDLCYRLLPTLPMEIYGIDEATGVELIRPKSIIGKNYNKTYEISRYFLENK